MLSFFVFVAEIAGSINVKKNIRKIVVSIKVSSTGDQYYNIKEENKIFA